MLGENTDVQIADFCGISEFQNMLANMELRVKTMNIVINGSRKMSKTVAVFLKLLMTKKIFGFVIRSFYRK